MNAMTKGALVAAVLATATFGVWIAVDRAHDEIAPTSVDAPASAPAALVGATTEAPSRAARRGGARSGGGHDRAVRCTAGACGDVDRGRSAARSALPRSLRSPVRGVRVTLPKSPGVELPPSAPDGRFVAVLERPPRWRTGPMRISTRRAPATPRGPAKSSSCAARRAYLGDRAARAGRPRSRDACSRPTGCPRGRARGRDVGRDCA
jgi:hypothetical protein